VINVATLPGIVGAAMAMPDIHWGYGFPIGGVAAFDVDDGIVSPGGVGYDINCGVRLMACKLTRAEVQPRLQALVGELFSRVPTGVGAEGAVHADRKELRAAAVEGAGWAARKGWATAADIEHIEERGCMRGADPEQVSGRAWERGKDQLGTLGSGNHFLEIGYVSEVFDAPRAAVMGLAADGITVTIHCGSRGFGHQVCEDALHVMDRAARRYGIDLPDRQLACAPVRSDEGQAYLGAMRCAVNYAFANRQIIAHRVREAFHAVFRGAPETTGLRTVYEIAHNIAKIETHDVDGARRALCVHRKGATRAFAGNREEVPAAYRAIGQPVLIPGDMGRYSYVLTGTERAMADTFGSTCHGAGRLMSRHGAIRAARGRNIGRELADRGILVRARDPRTLCEEMPEAYKDVADVVEACAEAGISRIVARITPIGCIKG
jgi:tRNA-splicing ligase RtcB